MQESELPGLEYSTRKWNLGIRVVRSGIWDQKFKFFQTTKKDQEFLNFEML